jgi:acyl carrier protein
MTVCVKRDSHFFKGSRRWYHHRGIVRLCDGRWNIEMTVSRDDVQARLLALVKAILQQNAMTVEINPDSLLVDVGFTSMDMVNLMLGVEAEFDFTIPQAEITPENFQSVETLERMVVAQLQPAAA